MEESFFHTIMRELCTEMDIKIEKLSRDWILQLSRKGKVRHITGYLFDNNPQATSVIVADKYATYEVLKSQNVPVIEHTLIFNPAIRSKYISNDGVWHKVISEFSKKQKLVVKPNTECGGYGVELCHNIKEVEIAIQKLFNQNHQSISICPYYDIKTEYRVFYLRGQVLLIYGKTKPFVIGNGNSKLKELVEALHFPEKNVVQDNLKKLDLNYVPNMKEKIELSWKHNLSGGAIPKILEKGKLYEKIEQLAIQAGKVMNMNFTTIDIIQTVDNEFYIMEMNSGVCGDIFAKTLEDGYEKMKDIYRKALEDLFNQ